MNRLLNKLYKNNAIVYKALLFLITAIAIVYLFPKSGQFKYDFVLGKPWQYDNLYAPFDFAKYKDEREIEKEKEQLKKQSKKYFAFNIDIQPKIIAKFKNKISKLSVSDSLSNADISTITNRGIFILNSIYQYGLLDENSQKGYVNDKSEIVALRKGNLIENVLFSKILNSKDVLNTIYDKVQDLPSHKQHLIINNIVSTIEPNVFFDSKFTNKELEEVLNGISYTKGMISKGELIVVKGDVVEGEIYTMLKSFQLASQLSMGSKLNYGWIVFGYTVLVSLALLMLLLFLMRYRFEIYNNNNKVTFIFFNMFVMILAQTLVVKANADYLYVVPLSILPIVLKTFFDARLGLFTHVLTVLLLGFIVPNSFEFIYLHIIAGVVTILTVSELYKRANLFISIAQITLIYMITYLAFSVLKEGSANEINWLYFGLFVLNGLLSFLAVFFIYFYEKLFGLVSDVTLLELSNTNSKLLRKLNEKAPGTFQHSIQVANLAEASANEIGANSMLVRTGALYHDIGKMINPIYFTENQSTGVNPHSELSPKDSAKIILDHVINGVEIAKKNKLPDRIIDFIRTHHGTSITYYFYKMELEKNPDIEIDLKKFQYKGPIPFSRETAILMICDSAEAASKSLKEPTAQQIDTLVDKIVEKQKNDNQFINSDITFREIEKIKKIVKNKLMNIYHLRIEYPD
ncbi:MAG: HD family phosphohydrolase [Tenacibaculum sp.]